MEKLEKYQVNAGKVVAETIDGEVVIINLEKGDYYSLVKSGAAIWEAIEKGFSQKNIIDKMIQQYDETEENIVKNVSGFIDILAKEDLIVIEEIEQEDNTDLTEQDNVKNSNVNKLGFDLPTLEKYTDMEELLLLDPIHEVDEKAGWPTVKQ